jgi:hypothetical protein
MPIEYGNHSLVAPRVRGGSDVETSDLIQRLADRTAPVHRLWAPWRRTTMWLAISLLYGAAVVAIHLAGRDGPGRLDVRLLVEQGAILATAITAAIAAFSSTVPGRDARIGLLPLIPLAVWLASLGEGCLGDWQRFGAAGLALRADWDCGILALILSIVPAIAMIVMLRRGAPIMPRLSLALGALAVAALVNFALRIFHAGDISVMVLTWHFGGALVVAALGGQLGRNLLNWRGLLARNDMAPAGFPSVTLAYIRRISG